MLSGRDIVCFSSIDWAGLWQGHQEIMSRLAAAGNNVLFVEHTGARRARVSDLPRLVKRFSNWRRSQTASRATGQNLRVLSPLALPFPYSNVAITINRTLVGRQLRKAMARAGMRNPIAWVFLPTPLVRALVSATQPALTVYHCVDDFSSSSDEAAGILRSEESMLQDADVVFATSEALRQRLARSNDNVHLFPSGVNFERFEAARVAPVQRPADLQNTAGPIVIYVGNLHQWVDQDVIAKAARALPDFVFAFVGPISVDAERLRGLPNVRLLGGKAHEEIPGYLKVSRAALIPYRRAPYTDHVFPAKLNEYLAMGVPVVSTDLPEVRRYCDSFGDVVTIAKDADAFVLAVRGAVQDTDSARALRRIEAARLNGWQQRLEQMCAVIE